MDEEQIEQCKLYEEEARIWFIVAVIFICLFGIAFVILIYFVYTQCVTNTVAIISTSNGGSYHKTTDQS